MTKTILITRPNPAATHTVAQLKTAQCQAIASPLLKAVKKPFAWPEHQYGCVVLTSARAVEDLGQLPASIAGCKTYTVGSTTAAAARNSGFKKVADLPPNIKTVQSLTNYLIEHVACCAVLYLCGEQRTNDLEKLLSPSGFTTTLIETYTMEPLSISKEALSALKNGDIFGVAHFSSATAERFVAEMETHGIKIEIHALHHICMSENIAQVLVQCGYVNIHLAQTPTNDAMLDKCKQICEQS